ncbi:MULTISPECIES: isoprenylcysteine carboxylmethyltransferase family protein [unclassified Pseudomonas]|uniref:methyltransferase family protein n=1 Tax=unclassified Pseudomonas TaxID=196821 RepID=UPI00244A80BE|nr:MULTISPECIES: isoprenylcysteine carboxylmethyltransferase family protein [unclassified Pseudomonas]MDH0893617.1 isoprenylcysteine carboxylmethyltransferase family protein [Pseudomonas sp. GD03875]MDH1065732.1 isoprenylcysteine carboxylmethyltransferase family protein [Pseudomonas sp. GD03985]
MWMQVVGFLVGSLILLGISWRTLRNPRSHGFYRFLAWEAMLALLVLNAPVWFEDRYALHQKVSWVLLFGSLTVLFLGLYQLRRDGRPGEQRQDDELYAFERTSRLVTGGIYRFIRHPLFCSLLLLTWGIVWKDLHGVTLLLGLVASVLLYLAARRDEAECLDYFGEAYREYMGRSRMFIPYVF